MRSLLIFDLDGTLADTAPDLLATLNRVTAPHGIGPMQGSHIGQIIGHGAKAMIARAFEIEGKRIDADLQEQLLGQFLEDYRKNLAVKTVLFDGVPGAMDSLEAQGWRFAVCTNKRYDMAIPLLKELNVLHRFRAVTGGDSFAFRKPDPRHLRETANLAGFELNAALMIGDSETDINAAIHAGIPSIAVTFGYTHIPAGELGADAVISNFDQLPQKVAELKHR